MRKEENDDRKLIHDYALEPELVADCDEFLYRYFQYKEFGWDTGRVVVQYPSTWIELVKGLVGDEKRLEALLTWLPIMIRCASDSLWKDTFTWLENAEADQKNSLYWFHVILARDNPRDQANVVRGADISPRTARVWNQPPSSITVDRTAASMAARIKPMLRYAKRIRFIDPHFDPTDIKYRSPLRKFLSIICYRGRSGRVTLEYHASADGRNYNWDTFENNCQTHLPALIPKGFSITIRLWWNKSGGERFHNRYILTDIGGVHFGNSIKEEPQGIDTISRLSSTDSLEWNAKYSDRTSAFDLEGQPIVIEGCRNI